MEDRATDTPYVMLKTAKMIDNLYIILGIEILHPPRRSISAKPTSLGKGTHAAQEALRETIPFLDTDRNLSVDVAASHRLLAERWLLARAKEAVREKLRS
jgi:histidine ammonia-lyase